jgi:hypothetical protein
MADGKSFIFFTYNTPAIFAFVFSLCGEDRKWKGKYSGELWLAI